MVRDVHVAVARRVFGLAGRGDRRRRARPGPRDDPTPRRSTPGSGGGLREAGRGLRHRDRHGLGCRIEDSPQGRPRGGGGERLHRATGSRRADQARHDPARGAAPGRRRTAGACGLATAFPARPPTSWCSCTGCRRPRPTGTGTPGDARDAWHPGGRLNTLDTGLPARHRPAGRGERCRARLAARRPVRRSADPAAALAAHTARRAPGTDGEAATRAACASPPTTRPWTDLVTNVATLGTPHLGAPLERGWRWAPRCSACCPSCFADCILLGGRPARRAGPGRPAPAARATTGRRDPASSHALVSEAFGVELLGATPRPPTPWSRDVPRARTRCTSRAATSTC